MKGLLIAAVGLFYATSSFSQFTDSTERYFNYASTGVINKTNNSQSYVFSNGVKFSVRKKKVSLNSASSWIYGQQQHRLTNNDVSSTLDFNLYRSPRFYYWGLGAFDKSYSLKINSREQAGLGVAYSFLNSKTAYLNVSDGILYEASNLNIGDSLKNDYHTIRNSLRLRHRFTLNKIVVLEGTYFWQPSFQDKNDYVLKSNTTLSVKLRTWLNLMAAANYNRVNRTGSENLLITFGLAVEKYF